MNAESRREMRRVFLESFLAELREREATDAGSGFLLGVFRQSHNGKNVFTAMDAANGDVFDERIDNATTGDGMPNISGKWSRGVGSGFVDYTDKTR